MMVFYKMGGVSRYAGGNGEGMINALLSFFGLINHVIINRV